MGNVHDDPRIATHVCGLGPVRGDRDQHRVAVDHIRDVRGLRPPVRAQCDQCAGTPPGGPFQCFGKLHHLSLADVVAVRAPVAPLQRRDPSIGKNVGGATIAVAAAGSRGSRCIAERECDEHHGPRANRSAGRTGTR